MDSEDALSNVIGPIQQLAIDLLEKVIDVTGQNIKGEKWYELEDHFTQAIETICLAAAREGQELI